jgi:hypothetical protein
MNFSMTGSMVLVSALFPERADHEGEAVLAGEQADGNLRLQPPLLGEPGLAEPVALVRLKVERRYVIEHQRRRPKARVRGAGLRQPLPPRLLRPGRQAPVERGIRRRGSAGLLQDPQRVLLAGRLDDPCQHELPEHFVMPGGLREPEHVIGPAQGVPQMGHLRGGDLQRPGRPRPAQAEVELRLPGRQPLPGRGIQRLELGVIMR